LVFLKTPGSEELLELCSFPASGPVQVQPDLTHLAFEVDDLDQFARHLAALGLKYSDGPHFKEDGSGFGIFAQRYNADGTVIDGSKVQVNTTTLDDQSSPAIATDGAGNTLIVWQSKDDELSNGIFGKWFYANGSTGNEFQLNSTESGDQTKPDVAMDALGRAVVTWQSLGQDGDGWGVYYARLDSVGDMTGSELAANVATTGDQQAPSVAAAASDGQFVIAWQGPGPVEEEGEEASVEVFARRFDSDGDAQGDEVIVDEPEGSDPARRGDGC
jgi:hypothetical protein